MIHSLAVWFSNLDPMRAFFNIAQTRCWTLGIVWVLSCQGARLPSSAPSHWAQATTPGDGINLGWAFFHEGIDPDSEVRECRHLGSRLAASGVVDPNRRGLARRFSRLLNRRESHLADESYCDRLEALMQRWVRRRKPVTAVFVERNLEDTLFLLRGMESRCGANQVKTYFWQDQAELLAQVRRALWRDQVAALAGGIEGRGDQLLRAAAVAADMPYLRLGAPIPGEVDGDHVVDVFLSYQHLAERLVAEAVARGGPKLALVRGADGDDDRLYQAVRRVAATTDGVEIAADEVLGEGNYPQMLRATAALAGGDLATMAPRRGRLAAVQLQFEGILFLGGPQTLQLFAKLLQFHGVKNAPVIGPPQLRDLTLLQPWNAFLSNAYVIDPVGPYELYPEQAVQRDGGASLLASGLTLGGEQQRRLDMYVLGAYLGDEIARRGAGAVGGVARSWPLHTFRADPGGFRPCGTQVGEGCHPGSSLAVKAAASGQ